MSDLDAGLTGARGSRISRAATLFLLAGAAYAESNGGPVGADFQVNTYTTSGQQLAAVSTFADGGFVVVWTSRGSSGDDSSFDSIQGQRFSPEGAPLGAEFQVNGYTTSSQIDPSIAADADGNFVVVWESYGSNGSDNFSYSIQGRRYSSEGVPLDAEFQVNGYTLGLQKNPSVAAAPDGDFIVVWDSSASSGDSDNFSVQGQRYSAAGSPLGGQFQVNTYTTSQQIFPAIAVDAGGNFVVAYQSRGSTGDDSGPYSVQARRFSAEGVPQGAEFQVNTYTTHFQADASVAMDDDGDFVIVWKSNGSNGSDSSSYSIQGQRYSANGEAQGAEFQVNSYTTQFQRVPSVASEPDGGFVVTWQSSGSNGGDNSSYSIQGQRFSAEGAPVGVEFQVNSYTTARQSDPSIAMDAAGDFVVVWQGPSSSGSDPSYNIQGRRFGRTIFVDGFDSGDPGNWSAVAP